MRLLGKCPNCGAEDAIVTDKDAEDATAQHIHRCGGCGVNWRNWTKLVFDEGKKRNRLIPVLIDRTDHRVHVVWPAKHEILHAHLITVALNTALMQTFGIHSSPSAEGGLEGVVKGEPIELRNDLDDIGLEDHLRIEERPQCEEVLNCYEQLLTNLLEEEEPSFKERHLRRGAILKLAPGDSLRDAKAAACLLLAISRTCGGVTARETFDRLREWLAGFNPNIPDLGSSGLPLDQIVQLYAARQ